MPRPPRAESRAQFDWPREVRMVDTDATGLAHFGSYVRMMEEAEYAFLRSRGLCVVMVDDRGTLGFPRLHCSLSVHQPLVLGQQVTVRLHLIEVTGKQIQYRFEIMTKDSDVAVEGRFDAACCRFPAQKPPYAVLMPERVLSALTGQGGSSNDGAHF